MTPKEKILKAAELLEKTGWTKKWFARDERGHHAAWDDRKAVKFCMLGACYRSNLYLEDSSTLIQLAKFIRSRHRMDSVSFNDSRAGPEEVIQELRAFAETLS